MTLQGWKYRKSHAISGSTTDYQIKIIVHYGSGTSTGSDVYLDAHCDGSAFADVRFADSDGKELSYWMETYPSFNPYDFGTFWVKVPQISSDTTIYIYYGKSGATSTGSGDDTFLLFDHFDNGTSLDTNKWTCTPGVIQEYGICYINGADTYVKSVATFSYDTAIRARLTHNSGNSGFFGYNNDVHFYDLPFAVISFEESRSLCTTGNDTANTMSTVCTAPTGMFAIFDFLRVGTSAVKYYRNGSLWANHTTTANIPTISLPVQMRVTYNSPDFGTDWILVRKVEASEPTQSTWGAEETVPEISTTFQSLYDVVLTSTTEFSSIYGIDFAIEFTSIFDILITTAEFTSIYSALCSQMFQTAIDGGVHISSEFRTRIGSITGVAALFEEIF